MRKQEKFNNSNKKYLNNRLVTLKIYRTLKK